MDLLVLAEENFIISFGISIGIGLLHGAILGRGIRNRFPSLKRHARAASIILLILFSINTIASIIKFAIPEKFSVSDFQIPSTLDEAFTTVVSILGLDAGLGSVIVMFVSISLVLFFKLANIHKISRYFIFSLSVLVLLVAILARFTDYVPSGFQVFMYAFYQFGITIGIFLVTRKKEIEELPDIS